MKVITTIKKELWNRGGKREVKLEITSIKFNLTQLSNKWRFVCYMTGSYMNGKIEIPRNHNVHSEWKRNVDIRKNVLRRFDEEEISNKKEARWYYNRYDLDLSWNSYKLMDDIINLDFRLEGVKDSFNDYVNMKISLEELHNMLTHHLIAKNLKA